MVEEFEFFRNVRSYYCHVKFTVSFTYRFSHRHSKRVMARGSFGCGVNVRSQTVEYVMQLKSDPIERPRSESGSFLFTTLYEAIPSQMIEFENYPIYKVRYRVPIDYDWQQFVVRGAENAINPGTIGQLFRKWKLHGANGEAVDAGLKVEKIEFHW
ncbi:hypothetical protein [Paenibacillus soyae]|uniref:Uncharacterized protein n=1 Tax=Paenibacillus soyae TaxID=2969249 RepID=A0A9X2ML23_9BACL|nr:hypothetical protein [Paenibacillus soyae]MCR2802554.1 hypothetical protein [Paenibacillus soyae]